MHLKLFNIILVNTLVSSTLFSSEILSPTQTKIYKLSKEKIKEDSSKLSKDWINPIMYQYSYKKSDKVIQGNEIGVSKNSMLSINQPIFRSGGIYYAIKYASSLEKSCNLSLDIQKKQLIAQALNTVLNIKKLDLQISQQQNLLQNANIDLKIKKESIFNGLLDISFLNNALLIKNKNELALLNLQFNKDNLINNLKNISHLPYDEIKLPKLKLLTKEEFQINNLNLQKNSYDINNKDYLSGITNAKYLPVVSLNYNKTLNHITNKDVDVYGFDVSIPIDFKGFADSSSSKIAYLKAKEELKLTKYKEMTFLNTKLLLIKNIDKKIALTLQNIKAYNILLKQTREYLSAGLKTKNDVQVLKNSRNNEKLNIDIFDIEKQSELLQLYTRIHSDKI